MRANEFQQQNDLGRRLDASKMYLSPPGSLGCCSFYSGSSVVVDSLLNVPPAGVCGGSVFGPCFAMRY